MFDDGFAPNVWATRTTQTLPDGSKIIVYANHAGMTMLYVNLDAAGVKKWARFSRYHPVSGYFEWEAEPSAVTGYDEAYDDLLNYNSGTGRYQYLRDGDGLIRVILRGRESYQRLPTPLIHPCCKTWTPGWQIMGYTASAAYTGKQNCWYANYLALLPAGIPALGEITVWGAYAWILARAGSGWRGGLYGYLGVAAVGATSQVYAMITAWDLCNDEWCTAFRQADTYQGWWCLECGCIQFDGSIGPLERVGERRSP